MKKHIKRGLVEERPSTTGLTTSGVGPPGDHDTAKMAKKSTPSQIKNRMGLLSILFIALVFSVIAFAIYSPSLHGPFIFDDEFSIQKNPPIHITTIAQLKDLIFSEEVDRTIGYISFALNYYFGGLNTFGYHLVNVIIHILNGIVLLLLSHTVLTCPSVEGKVRENAFRIALLGSLLWLVHPMQSQAVSYVVQRLTSLCSLFFMLSLLCYIKGRLYQAKKGVVFFIFSILFGLLALGTKQNAATLPFFIILTEFSFLQPRPFKVDKKKLGYLLLVAGLFILIAAMYLGPDFLSRIAQRYEISGWTPLERILTQLRVVVLYVSLLFYPLPSRLNLDYDFSLSYSLFSPFSTFLSLLIITGALALAIALMKKQRLISYAIFWFFGNLVIESSIIPLELVFEHRVYLPSMGLSILFVGLSLGVTKIEWKKWVAASLIPIIALFSYWTYERAYVWSDELFLWEDAAKKSPNKARPHYNLGLAYNQKGRLDEAVSQYKRALAINPRYANAHTALGVVYNKQGRLDEAIFEYKQDLAINPNSAEAHYNLGNAYHKKGSLNDAVFEYQKAIAISPNLVEAHHNLGLVYEQKGSLDDAVSAYKKALIINPNLQEAHYNLGRAYTKLGRLDEAASEHRKILDVNPNSAEGHNNLGLTYSRQGRMDEAISEYRKALAINPNFAEVHHNLGLIYDQQGRLDEAIFEYEQALAINPRNAQAFNNLGNVHLKKGVLGKAVSEYKQAIVINPDYAKAHNNLSYAYYSQGNYQLAVFHCDKALELGYSVPPKLLRLLNPYR